MTEPGHAEHGWLSLHIHRAAGQDRLLVELIRPLLDDLSCSGLISASFYLRYWDGGSHIRLRVRPATAGSEPVARRVLAGRCTAFLRRYPAVAPARGGDYAAMAARLAQLEGLTSYQRRPQPEDSLIFAEYHREHDRYGYGAAIQSAERHFAESSAIALGLLARRPARADVLRAGFAMLVVARQLAGEPAGSAAAVAPRAGLAAQGPAGAGPAGAGPAGAGPAGAGPERWTAVTGEAGLTALSAAAGRLRTAAAEHSRTRSAEPLDAWAASVARLTGRLQDAAADPGSRLPAGGVRPVIDMCAHLMCNRLGILPSEEWAVRGLAATTQPRESAQ